MYIVTLDGMEIEVEATNDERAAISTFLLKSQADLIVLRQNDRVILTKEYDVWSVAEDNRYIGFLVKVFN